MTELPQGRIEATVLVLTSDQAREEYPYLFSGDLEDGYFGAIEASGNSTWVDYVPELVLIVASPQGRIISAADASAWHLRSLGYQSPSTDGGSGNE